MKLSRLFVFLTFICLFSCKNERKSPDSVNGQGLSMQQDFAKRYPKAQEVVWDTLDLGFAALFSDDSFEYTSQYDAKGVFQFTATFIEQTALPVVVQQIMENKYKNAAVAVIKRVEKDKTQTYIIELESNTDYITLEFDGSGKILKEEKHPLSNEELQLEEEEGVDEKEK
jgi:hypothetical protein